MLAGKLLCSPTTLALGGEADNTHVYTYTHLKNTKK